MFMHGTHESILQVEADEASVDDSTTLERMNTFFKMACQSSCEGIMLKILDVDAGYSASKRCDSWLKVQPMYYTKQVPESECFSLYLKL